MNEAARLNTLVEMAKESQNRRSVMPGPSDQPRRLPELERVLKRMHRPAPEGWLGLEYGLPFKC